MTKKKEYKIGDFTISRPFKSHGEGTIYICINLDLNKIVDGYDYHDFPPSVEVYWTKDKIKELRDTLNEILKDIENG